MRYLRYCRRWGRPEGRVSPIYYTDCTYCLNVAERIRRNLARFVWPGWGCFPATSVRVLLLLCLPFPKGILWAPLGFPLKTRNLDSNFFFACSVLCRGCYPATFRPRYIWTVGTSAGILFRDPAFLFVFILKGISFYLQLLRSVQGTFFGFRPPHLYFLQNLIQVRRHFSPRQANYEN